MANKNDPAYLEDIKTKIFQNLSNLEHAPSVQMHEVPPDLFDHDIREAKLEQQREKQRTDHRVKEHLRDEVRLGANEYFEDEMDHDHHAGTKISGKKANGSSSSSASAADSSDMQ
jgi:histone deacetylase 1/2